MTLEIKCLLYYHKVPEFKSHTPALLKTRPKKTYYNHFHHLLYTGNCSKLMLDMSLQTDKKDFFWSDGNILKLESSFSCITL